MNCMDCWTRDAKIEKAITDDDGDPLCNACMGTRTHALMPAGFIGERPDDGLMDCQGPSLELACNPGDRPARILRTNKNRRCGTCQRLFERAASKKAEAMPSREGQAAVEARWTEILDKCAMLPIGSVEEFTTDRGADAKKFADNLRSMLAGSNRTMKWRWGVKLLATGAWVTKLALWTPTFKVPRSKKPKENEMKQADGIPCGCGKPRHKGRCWYRRGMAGPGGKANGAVKLMDEVSPLAKGEIGRAASVGIHAQSTVMSSNHSGQLESGVLFSRIADYRPPRSLTSMLDGLQELLARSAKGETILLYVPKDARLKSFRDRVAEYLRRRKITSYVAFCDSKLKAVALVARARSDNRS